MQQWAPIAHARDRPSRPGTWPAREEVPSVARALVDHIALPGITEELAQHHLAEDYAHNLWPPER